MASGSPPATAARAIIADARDALAAAGVPSPQADAELIAAFVLDTPRGMLGLAEFSAVQRERFAALVAERAQRVPLQHLTGEVGFRRLTLAVGPGVFVPRPETELLVSWGLSRLDAVVRPLVVDLCAGSGAIALSMVAEHPGAVVHAVEVDQLAYAWLERNAQQVSTGDSSVRLHHADATFAGTLAELDGTVDLVLSNPPYIPLRSDVAAEVRHDPDLALWGGADGLDVVRGVVATAARLLRPGGWFGFEHGEQQADAVRSIMDGWRDVAAFPDLTGRIRGTVARR